MSGLWWLQRGWTEAACGSCGQQIYPEGDPDWGLCWGCKQRESEQAEYDRQMQERYDQEMREMEDHFRRHPHG